jgi:hypothetical protein
LVQIQALSRSRSFVALCTSNLRLCAEGLEEKKLVQHQNRHQCEDPYNFQLRTGMAQHVSVFHRLSEVKEEV